MMRTPRVSTPKVRPEETGNPSMERAGDVSDDMGPGDSAKDMANGAKLLKPLRPNWSSAAKRIAGAGRVK